MNRNVTPLPNSGRALKNRRVTGNQTTLLLRENCTGAAKNACVILIRMRLFLISLFLPLLLCAQQSPSWVAKSNKNAELLLDISARYSPEEAGSLGVKGMDDQIWIPAADEPERERRDTKQALDILRSRLATEQDPLVKQDIEILIQAGERNIRASEGYEKLTLPYTNVARHVFFGIRTLLDEQVPPGRRRFATVRLRRYTGLEQGFTPTTVRAEKLLREKLSNSSLLGPPKAEVEQDLATADSYISGIGELFEKSKLTGYEAAYASLKGQMADYQKFVRNEVLPRARTDFRLPPELYAINLEHYGVDYTPSGLTRLAHQNFNEIQGQMQALAARIAKERSLPSADYRDVIKALKKEQLKPEQIMPLYHDTLAKLEEIIRHDHLVTLPDRPCIIKSASAAETAEQPSPHYHAPPMLNNRGEQGQFLLPGGIISPDGKPLKYDDFTFAAASWTLTAHEARPGHDLQFASMVEQGVSDARAIFAFNSTNVEGWAVYSEWFMLPYMPDDGKLISLQLRLMRAARAFLDPELQQGIISRQQALELLQKDVVLSEAFATEEVDRFTFRIPGQSVAYFDGYTRFLQMRADAEKALGSKFDLQKFHDFVLSRGMLPPSLLRQTIMTDFVGKLERSADSRSRLSARITFKDGINTTIPSLQIPFLFSNSPAEFPSSY